MKRHIPLIALVFVFSAAYVASNWWMLLLSDPSISIGLPFGMCSLFAILSVALFVVYTMPRTERRSERLKSILFMLAIVLGALLFNVAYGRGLPRGSFAADFDSASWRREESSLYCRGDLTTRQKMLGSVVHQILPKGNRVQIEELLGEMVPESYFADLKPDLLYRLGPERGFLGIDSEWLAVWFDENSLVERWELLTD